MHNKMMKTKMEINKNILKNTIEKLINELNIKK